MAFALVSNSFKPIGEALVPDFIAPERRSRANAAVKIASSITVIVAALVSLLLVDDHPNLSFVVIALITVVAVTILCLSIRDSSSPGYQAALAEDAAEKANPVGEARVRDTVVEIVRDADRSRLLLVLAIFVFGCAWAASRSLVTPYGMEVLDLSRGDAGGLTLPSGVAFLLAAYPTALLAERIGRLRTMAAGMSVFVVGMLVGFRAADPDRRRWSPSASRPPARRPSWSTPSSCCGTWRPSARVFGTYAAIYAVGWQAGAFLGPAIVGGAVDVLGWSTMLLDIAVIATVATLIVLRIDAPPAVDRRGEGGLTWPGS